MEPRQLHEYLTQTDAPIPTKLEKHPASHAKPGHAAAVFADLARFPEPHTKLLYVTPEQLAGSARLRGVAMEALSHLTRRARIGPTGDADRTEQVRERILHKLIEARWVTDGSGMGLEPNPQSTNTAAKDLPARR